MDIKEPNIPEDTKIEMAKFFMKTSIPRIINEKKKELDELVEEEET